jgi:hypothetical protein
MQRLNERRRAVGVALCCALGAYPLRAQSPHGIVKEQLVAATAARRTQNVVMHAESQEIVSAPAPPLSRAPAADALLIGIERYERGFDTLSPTVANNLSALRNVLIKRGYSADSIHILTNASEFETALEPTVHFHRDITNREVSDELMRLRQADRAGHIAIVYFVGHGGTYHHNRHVASSLSTPGDGLTFFALAHIAQQIAVNAPKSNKLLLVDACSNASLNTGSADAFSEAHGMNSIFSSRLEQTSGLDRTLGMSYFTHFLVEALQHVNARATPTTLFHEVELGMESYFAARDSSVGSCRDVTPGVDPFATSVGKAPEQCPAQIAGPSFSLFDSSTDSCAALAQGPNEDVVTRARRIAACKRKARDANRG